MTGFDNIDCASRTDVGIRRSHNQDAHVVMPATDADEWRQRGHVFLVADGMGAHAVGELASKMAVDNIPHVYSKYAREGAMAALRRAFVEANGTIHTRGQQNRDFHGMGTTATALILRADGAWVGHVGDSRVYRIRNGTIEQLSFDHSLIWELARRQQKAPEEMHGIPPNVIVRSLGPEPLVQVDVEGPHPVQPGDTFLLCSDGLSGQVTDREIGAVVSALSPSEACEFLVHLANLQGGPDNITVVVVHVDGAGAAASHAEKKLPPTAAASAAGQALLGHVRSLLRKVPVAFVLLGVGILLAVLAVALLCLQMSGGFPAFVLAGLTLFGGVVGLMVQNFRETRVRPEPEDNHKPTVYRHTTCTIDPPLIEKLAQATKSLEANIHEKGWQLADDAYRDHMTKSQRAAGEAHLQEAFAEQCRALRVLMDAVHQQRSREESFRPLWDRDSTPNGLLPRG